MKFLGKVALVSLVGVGSAMSAPTVGTSQAFVSNAVGVKATAVEDFQTVLRYKAQALKEKDVIKLNCVNDKLVQIQPLMNLIDGQVERISLMEGSPDQEALSKDIANNGSAVREQRELASQCTDSKLIITESSNSATGPDVEDPHDPLPEPLENIEPPGYASPDR